MDDGPEAVWTPTTPQVSSLRELRQTYIARARRTDDLRAGRAQAPSTASARQLGAEWGVGVGLHFEMLRGLRWLALLLIACAVPFLVVIGCSVFTDAAHMEDHTYGVKKYPPTKIHALTFAAIVDDSVDNGTLQYMNTELGSTWRGPMRKSTFLIWISLLDAGSLLLFAGGLALLWRHLRRFAAGLDAAALEASAYTVLVRGLPGDCHAAQVGEHFSRYGEVMDVVLVTERLGDTLAKCGRAARLQQRRAMVLDASTVSEKHAHLDRLRRLDERVAALAEDIRGVAERPQRARVAFVTFNSENERRACIAHCPNSWLGSMLQPRGERFRGCGRFWVRRAAAPDDYQFEHLAAPEWQRAARQLAINLLTLLLVLLCAAAITKLTDMSNRESASVRWFRNALNADASGAFAAYGNNPGLNLTISTPINATTTTSATIPYTTTTTTTNSSINSTSMEAPLAAFCTAELAGPCSAQLASRFGGTVSLAFGHAPIWTNATARLLLERPLRAALQNCAHGSTAGAGDACGLQACLPCLCLGMSAVEVGVEEGGDGDSASAWVGEAQQVCPRYINPFDARTWGVRLSISAVVAGLNAAIKWILRALARHGRHWTHTAREVSSALQCAVAQLVNTVGVLLLVNCDALGRLARQGAEGSWVRFFVQYGSYSDFSAAWYENVGLSIMILMLLNVASPLLNVAADWGQQLALRARLRACLAWPLQADYDAAWARPRFTLEQRTADLLLNASLTLLFGTGMPLLYPVFLAYLLVAEAADRWALTRMCGGAPRYSKGLMRLVMGLLPWLCVAHLAFGLWMHTHFQVVSDGSDDVSELGLAAVRATNARLSAASTDLYALQRSSVWRRITQPNGLAPLLALLAMALWLLAARFVVPRLLSCTARTADRLCRPAASRAMRAQLARDARLQLGAVPFAEALTRRQLRGSPTYRLAHHPHYLPYFAASGLNRAAGVAALVVAAANGGTGRLMYTRLKPVVRRGRTLGGPTTFIVLPEPITDATAAGLLGISGGGGDGSSDPRASGADAARAATPGDIESGGAGGGAGKPKSGVAGVGLRGGPDVCELLAAEEAQQRLITGRALAGHEPAGVAEVRVREDGEVEVAPAAAPHDVSMQEAHTAAGEEQQALQQQQQQQRRVAAMPAATAACIVRASHGSLRIQLPLDPPGSAGSTPGPLFGTGAPDVATATPPPAAATAAAATAAAATAASGDAGVGGPAGALLGAELVEEGEEGEHGHPDEEHGAETPVQGAQPGGAQDVGEEHGAAETAVVEEGGDVGVSHVILTVREQEEDEVQNEGMPGELIGVIAP